MVKLFVGGLPPEVKELDLVQIIAIYGEVQTIKVIRDKLTNKCKGYAFLEMKDYDAAKNVIMSLSGELFKKNTLFFNVVEEKPKLDQMVFKKKSITPKDSNLPKIKRPRKKVV
jgi:RNA recognition motif-containing protein